MPVDALLAAISELAETDASERSDPETLCALMEARSALESVLASSGAAFEAEGAWADLGARSPSMWLARSTHQPTKVAKSVFRRGRARPKLPVAAGRFATGAISGDHLDVFDAHLRPATAKAMARDEALLCRKATEITFAQFCQLMDYWDTMADPDGAGGKEAERYARRHLSIAKGWEGMVQGEFNLDPIGGDIVLGELTRLERILYDAEVAEATARLGREPTKDELSTLGQRLADALRRMAERSAGADGTAPARPLITIVTSKDTVDRYLSELEDGTHVHPSAWIHLLFDGEFERILFTPNKRAECSERARFFTGATRRAVQLRDRRCQHPFCEEPISRCQVDHIVDWTEGGPTTQENGQLLCGFHNRWKWRQRHKAPPPEG